MLCLQAPRDVCLAAADDATRQRCVRVIQAASAGTSFSLQDIASAAALTPGLMDMKSVAAVNAVFAALGCDWSAIRTAGFTVAEARAAGCDVKSAQAAGYDLPSLLVAYGESACIAAGCDMSHILVSCSAARAGARSN